mgnify:CR=1 FL=1
MSSITTVNQTENQVQFNIDQSKMFIWDNRYENVTFRNLTGGTLSYAVGTVLGRISATGKVTEMKSAATDGSELPIGILATVITDLATVSDVVINMCTAGDVAEEKLIFNGADVITTAEQARIYRDWLQLAGIKAVLGTDLTGFDNQ